MTLTLAAPDWPRLARRGHARALGKLLSSFFWEAIE